MLKQWYLKTWSQVKHIKTLFIAVRSHCDYRKLIIGCSSFLSNLMEEIQHKITKMKSRQTASSNMYILVDVLRPLLIRHYNLICFSPFKTSANCYPWKQMMFLLGRSDLKGFPPMKTTGGRWKVWGATAEKVVLFLWLKCTLRARLKCYLLTSSARLCGVRVVKPGRLSVSLFLTNKGCLFKTVWWSEKKKGSTFKNSSVNCVWTTVVCIKLIHQLTNIYV